MKKILIFSLAYYPRHVSGAEAAVREITDRINPSDIEFHMITLRFDKGDSVYEQVGVVHVHRVGGSSGYLSKIFFIPRAILKARALHKQQHFSAVWALMTYMTIPAVLSRMCGVRIPLILTLQDGDPYEKVFNRVRIRLFAPIIDWGFRSAAVIQVISQYLGTWPMLRGSQAPVVLIHNGANPKDIADTLTSEDVAAAQAKLGKKQGDIFLVNTARLEYQKAQDDVIRALPLLPTHVKFLVVGGGTDERMLKALAAELSLADRVIFTGHVDRSEVTAYRRASDIFVAPSRSEGLGNAFLSAMASRLPVVATQEGGLAEFIFDGSESGSQKTAWVVHKDSPQEIADAVLDILAHPDDVLRVTERAREMVVREYNWDTIARDMREKVFARVV